MAITKKFGKVAIVDIHAPKTTTPGAKQGMIVVYAQGLTSDYVGTGGQSAAKASLGISAPTTERSYAGERKFSEFWSMAELEQANNGGGLAIGDQVEGVCISSLRSKLPFCEGQQPYARTGLFYSPAMEAGQEPNDRLVDNSHLPHNVKTALAATTLDKQHVKEAVEVE